MEHAVNAGITSGTVLLIDADGTNLGPISTGTAIAHASEQGLDLVLIGPSSTPPVARVMDYSHYKYTQQKKARDGAKATRGTHTHQVRMRPMVADHDYRTKLATIRRFLTAHDRVKVSVVMHGRMITHPELAARLIARIVADTSDVSSSSGTPDLRGKDMSVLLTPTARN